MRKGRRKRKKPTIDTDSKTDLRIKENEADSDKKKGKNPRINPTRKNTARTTVLPLRKNIKFSEWKIFDKVSITSSQIRNFYVFVKN